MKRSIDYSLVVVGAGAAGLGASLEAQRLGITHLVVEASHRIGGRGLTEMLEGRIPVDLGCHWMHCGSINPFVPMASRMGFGFSRGNPRQRSFVDGEWQTDTIAARREGAYERLATMAERRYRSGHVDSLWQAVAGEEPDLDWLNYWATLMHSVDLDQVAIADVAEFRDTAEDWPVHQGYGALIAAVGNDVPVRLNCPVEWIRWGEGPVALQTVSGTIRTDKVLITVSTGVLNAGVIGFRPALPQWKQDAAAQLALGNCNYVFFGVDGNGFSGAPESVAYQRGENCAILQIRPGGNDYVCAALGGRFAWWMEKQGEQATCHWFRDILQDVFGSNIASSLGRGKVSAWGYDPWIRGAYSARSPGAGDVRRELARPLKERLWFAGEATSIDQFCTAHGAWISGQDAIRRMFGTADR